VKKIAQNVAKNNSGKKICITFTVEKSRQTIWAISVLFIKQPKVNNDPIGENSPNLSTLITVVIAVSLIKLVNLHVHAIEILVLERVFLSCPCKHFGRKKTLQKVC
jgi:hypothetical protein